MEIHRNVGTAQIGGGMDVRTRLKLLFPIGLRGEVRDYYTLKRPGFGVPIQRREQHNVVVSAVLVVHFWTASARGRLVNVEDRMLDSLADHERQCQHGSQEGNGKAEFLTQRHWLLSPPSGRPVSGTPRVPQDQQRNQCGGSRNE